MKLKVSDYIVNFFNKNGVDTLFTITGGFAMHLNDSFGKHGQYNIYYQLSALLLVALQPMRLHRV
jgi:acetolactate synthase-1/2/3 large subunit